MGLKMIIAQTKVMVVDNTSIDVNNVLIDNVECYKYLGQHYSLIEKNQGKEMQRRITAGGMRRTPGSVQKQPCHLPDSCVHVCCQLGHKEQGTGQSPNKHITNLRPHIPNLKEVDDQNHMQ